MFRHQHVVILDDNSIDIFILENTLKRLGMPSVVKAFERPTLAIEFLTNGNWTPDLMFVDLKMPVLNGFEFIEWSVQRFPQTKFVVMSTSDDFLDIRKSFTYPQVINYIVKPVTGKAISEMRLAS